MAALRAARPPLPYECTHCKQQPVQTKVSITYVRGFLIWARLGERAAVGCVSCVRRAIFDEVRLSMLIGWFSPLALVLNPFAILNAVLQGLFLGRDPAAARKYLLAQGFPTGAVGDLLRVSYVLATAMLGGEWTAEASKMSWRERAMTRHENFSAERMAVVAGIGAEAIPGFDKSDFEQCVIDSDSLGHPLHIAEAASRLMSPGELDALRRLLSEMSRQLEFEAERQATFQAVLQALGKPP